MKCVGTNQMPQLMFVSLPKKPLSLPISVKNVRLNAAEVWVWADRIL